MARNGLHLEANLKPLAYTAAKCSLLSTENIQKPCTLSVFQKLWPFVSAHVRVFRHSSLHVYQNRPIGEGYTPPPPLLPGSMCEKATEYLLIFKH